MTFPGTVPAVDDNNTPCVKDVVIDNSNNDIKDEDGEYHDNWRIALYYCYVPIEAVDEQLRFQQDLCSTLSLRGRIRVSKEGLNGVLSGRFRELQAYKSKLDDQVERLLVVTAGATTRHDDDGVVLDFKYCKLRPELSIESQLFKSLSVKETKQVVSLVEEQQASPEQHSTSARRRSKQHGRRQRRRQEKQEQKQNDPKHIEAVALDETLPSARHLKPHEWKDRLTGLSSSSGVASSGDGGASASSGDGASTSDVVLMDCRNNYESRVGYFQVPNIPTILTNTRKYSDLPKVFSQLDLRDKQVFMYCTGGVRCERASMLLQQQPHPPKAIYQLRGGIQSYLETSSGDYYHGKNFVFDPRRTDPVHGGAKAVVGTCLLCDQSHDDYDNGHAPAENREARCWKCRTLVLVCDACRSSVSCWGETDNPLPKLYCGKEECEGSDPRPEQILKVTDHS